MQRFLMLLKHGITSLKTLLAISFPVVVRLTFYGGLIVAGSILIYDTRKHKIDIRHFADAVAPALMLAYGIGRLGCHFSGDDD